MPGLSGHSLFWNGLDKPLVLGRTHFIGLAHFHSPEENVLARPPGQQRAGRVTQGQQCGVRVPLAGSLSSAARQQDGAGQ